MASTTKHTAYTAAAATALTTELNALANGAASAASAAIDNRTTLNLFMDLELVLGTQAARPAGAVVEVYLVSSLDGTTYEDAIVGTSQLVAVFPLDAVVTARRVGRRDIPIPPALFKLFVNNRSGQAFAATANTLSYRFHNVASV